MQLRPYQSEAVERIVARGNLLLAMTMGSGKTATAIASVRQLRRQRRGDHGIVFALKSTKWQWVREIERWDPRARVQVIDGTKDQRTRGYRHAWRYHYNILHYQCLIHDIDLIVKYLPNDFVIFDEVTALKGFGTKTSKRAKALARRTPVRMGLSGQPVENRPEELFSIMEAIDAEVLGGFHKFDRTFIVRDHWGKPLRYRNLHLIQKRLGDAMYRKSREDIAEWLPEKVEIEMPVELEDDVMKLHDLIRADLSAAIDQAIGLGARGSFDVLSHYGRVDQTDRMSAMGQVMSRLLAMRMLSSHPALLRISADDFDTEVVRRGSEYASMLKAAGFLDNLPVSTNKLEALVELVKGILDEDPDHKVVIFSYFKPMLRMIAQALPGIPKVTITGDVTGRARDAAIVRFNTDPVCRLFLSSDAGAYGVDLNQGSHLICYDLPWSGGALQQRVSRIDRTNSAFPTINIIYMYGQDTIEERMYHMLVQKMKISRAFLDGEFDAKGMLKLDLESLREFLDA